MKKKTVYTFIAEDFEGAGQILIRTDKDPSAGDGAHDLSAIAYKVCWKPIPPDNEPMEGSTTRDHDYYLVSMADGHIGEPMKLEALLEVLNVEDYRPASVGEVIAIARYQGNRFSYKSRRAKKKTPVRPPRRHACGCLFGDCECEEEEDCPDCGETLEPNGDCPECGSGS